MAVDIVDKEIEKVKQGRVAYEAKMKRYRWIEEQRKKEKHIPLTFPELEQDGALSLKFTPAEEGKAESDRWLVEFSLRNTTDEQESFNDYQTAWNSFKTLFEKHGLEKNRQAKIEKEIADHDHGLQNYSERVRQGMTILTIGAMGIGIFGIISALLNGPLWLLWEVAAIFWCLVFYGKVMEYDRKQVRGYKQDIQKFQQEKMRSPF